MIILVRGPIQHVRHEDEDAYEVMDIKNLNEVAPFITKDGSEIRELLAHRNSAIRNQSLAEARLPVGGATQEHFHPRAEEIYYITHGTGKMRIEGETREVRAGDAIAIPPGQKHKLWNTGDEMLRLLCCCAPAYEHDDTIITESESSVASAEAGWFMASAHEDGWHRRLAWSPRRSC